MAHTLTLPTFEWHAPQGFGPRVACVNVKVSRHTSELIALIGDDVHAAEELTNAWWATACTVADGFGFGAEQHGRSGGWCVLTLNGKPVTEDDVDTRGLDAIEANPARSLVARLNRAAVAVLGVLTDVALIDLAVDLGFEGDDDEEAGAMYVDGVCVARVARVDLTV